MPRVIGKSRPITVRSRSTCTKVARGMRILLYWSVATTLVLSSPSDEPMTSSASYGLVVASPFM